MRVSFGFAGLATAEKGSSAGKVILPMLRARAKDATFILTLVIAWALLNREEVELTALARMICTLNISVAVDKTRCSEM
tara:strand:+ start:2381 stop:2617 length:237 start_codon:yes stop_codon:yes gene_type:complete